MINNTTVINVYNNRNSARKLQHNYRRLALSSRCRARLSCNPSRCHERCCKVHATPTGRAPVTATALVAPTPTSVRGAAQAGKRPPRQADEQRVIVEEPAATHERRLCQGTGIDRQSGQPIDTATLAGMSLQGRLPHEVEVVVPIRNAGPVPSPPLREGRPNRRDGPASNRGEAATPGQRTPPAAAPAVQPPPSPPVVPPAAAPGQAGRLRLSRARHVTSVAATRTGRTSCAFTASARCCTAS